MSSRLCRFGAGLVLASGAGQAGRVWSAPGVARLSRTAAALRLEVTPSAADLEAAAGNGATSSGFLVAVAPGVSPALRLLADHRRTLSAVSVSPHRAAE